jgi:hypothetical protein
VFVVPSALFACATGCAPLETEALVLIELISVICFSFCDKKFSRL